MQVTQDELRLVVQFWDAWQLVVEVCVHMCIDICMDMCMCIRSSSWVQGRSGGSNATAHVAWAEYALQVFENIVHGSKVWTCV